MKVFVGNSKDKKEHEEEFVEEELEQTISGYVGTVQIYNESVFINTNTGEGYDIVVRKMKDFIEYFASKIRFDGFDRNDLKQLIVSLMLDGIRRYDPKYDIKLSSFLHVHVKNRIISRIKRETRPSLNATLNKDVALYTCACGQTTRLTKDEEVIIYCRSCGQVFNEKWKVKDEKNFLIPLSSMTKTENGYSDDDYYGASAKHSKGIDFFVNTTTLESVDKDMDFCKAFGLEDRKTFEIAKLIYFDSYTITDPHSSDQ